MQNSCSKNFDELNSKVLDYKKCAELARLRKTSVHGVGAVNARIIIIGDFPREDGAESTGIPFTGDASGELIRKLINDSDLSLESDIYLTYLVKCNPRKKMSAVDGEKISFIEPAEEHKNNCIAYLSKEITIMTPHLLITLGLDTSKYILKYFFSIEKDVKEMEDLHMKLFENPSFKLVPFFTPHDVTVNNKISIEQYTEDFQKLSEFLKIV
jgi:uracil-DNA glycosylase family 4